MEISQRDRSRLSQIFSGSLPDDNYILYLQAVDENGLVSEVKDVLFTLETPPPIDLGSAYQFSGKTTPGILETGQSDRYTFKIRDTELLSTATDSLVIGVNFTSNNSGLSPALPSIDGLNSLSDSE